MLQASESPQIIFLFPDQHGTLSSYLLAMNTLPLESLPTLRAKNKLVGFDWPSERERTTNAFTSNT